MAGFRTGAAISVDNGVDSVGFNPPTTSTPSTNVRTTADGRFKLSQTFTPDAVEKEIVITMTVKNQTTLPITGVSLARFFDGDIAMADDSVAGGRLGGLGQPEN